MSHTLQRVKTTVRRPRNNYICHKYTKLGYQEKNPAGKRKNPNTRNNNCYLYENSIEQLLPTEPQEEYLQIQREDKDRKLITKVKKNVLN